MILHTYNEEEIINELTKDYAYVRSQARRLAKKSLNALSKKGLTIRKECDEEYDITTPQNNKWRLGIMYHPKGNAPWTMISCCVVESDHGNKDYYVLRGHSVSNPYFIKMSSHVIKRLKERNMFHLVENPADIACLTFRSHETAVMTKYIDVKSINLIQLVDDLTDLDDISDVITSIIGLFYGFRTKGGNVCLKTYVSPEMAFSGMSKSKDNVTKMDKESWYAYMNMNLHQYYNKFMYSEEELESVLYKNFAKDEELDCDNSKITLLRP